MLPDINLDNENYDNILDEARNMIISLYPEWTDYNYHDPGITMIELFASMKESQQYFLNQIGSEHREKYLKLLGMKRWHKAPARALLKVYPHENLLIPEGTKLYAGDACFETTKRKNFSGRDICFCFCVKDDTIESFISQEQLEFGHKLHFYPFGVEPSVNTACYVGLENPLPKEEMQDIYIEIFNEHVVRRKKLNAPMNPSLAKIRLQYATAGEWKDLEICEDQTYGLLQDGFVTFLLKEEMEKVNVCSQEAYYIRAVLEENSYDTPPVITNTSIHVQEILQKDTQAEILDISFCQEELIDRRKRWSKEEPIALYTYLSLQSMDLIFLKIGDSYRMVDNFHKQVDYDEGIAWIKVDGIDGNGQKDEENGVNGQEDAIDGLRIVSMTPQMFAKRIIGEGTGFPNQEWDLEDLQILYEDFQIMITDPEDISCFYAWDKVEDFAISTPGDRHYVMDSRQGKIRFGDCIHGMAPEGIILICGYAKTKGMDGNVKKNKIQCFESDEGEEIKVFNMNDAQGGRDEESLDDCFLRARKSLKVSDTAITYEDYERRVKEIPGLLIESCHVVPNDKMSHFIRVVDNMAIYIVIKPFGLTSHAKLSVNYEKNIRAWLEPCRLIGNRIEILQPEYVLIYLYAEITLKPQYFYARETVEKKVKEFFQKYEKEFGSTLPYHELYGTIQKMDEVSEIRALEVETKGEGVIRNAVGDIFLSPNGILTLEDSRYSFSISD
ncbi:baseplate J/gp47 family protein [Lachnospiraceae bacterium ZAX-1]